METIKLNEHLKGVSGKTVSEIMKTVNNAGVEDRSRSQQCIQLIMENINKINVDNDQEIQGCISVEEQKIKVVNATFSQARKSLDQVTGRIISQLKICVEMKDHVDSTECSARIDSLNNELTDNSGLAVIAYQIMSSDSAYNRAEREDCIDKSIRFASKKINEEQKKIGICLNSKM